MPAMAEEVVPAPAAPEPHFLVVTYPAQGHINPARHLARRLLRATGARVTVSTAVSAFRKMFPDAAAKDTAGGGVADGEGYRDVAGVWYVPYSDGYDGGFDSNVHDKTHYMDQVKLVGSRTLAAVLARLRDAGRPVTLVVYTLLLSWVADVAHAHGVPTALYWIQPASVLAAYFHFFRGTGGVDKAIAAAAGDPSAPITVPGLPAPLRIRDLPSFITSTDADDPYAFVADMFRELVAMLGESPTTTVLANTFDAMEPDAVSSLREHGVDVIPVGPVISFLDGGARHVRERPPIPLGAPGGQPPRRRRHRRGGARRREGGGGGVVRPGAGAFAPGSGVLRDALWVELDAGERGVRGAGGGCAAVDGPGNQRVAR
ncbi:unnamed protein product [Urochloa humidicola]